MQLFLPGEEVEEEESLGGIDEEVDDEEVEEISLTLVGLLSIRTVQMIA